MRKRDRPPPPRKSSTINLLLLGGGMLAVSMCLCGGCGRHDPYDPPWHDAQGHVVAKEWTTDADGHRHPAQPVFDADGKPIPFDANGNPVPPPGSTYSHSSSYHYHSGGGWFPYIYSSRSYGPTYRSGPTNTGSTYFGGSKPNSSPAPSHSPGSSSGSVSRGGFGGGSAAHASSSAS